MPKYVNETLERESRRMDIAKTVIDGVVVIKPTILSDERGYFQETYSEQRYRDAGINAKFVQDNESLSMKGVLRGLHYQKGEYAQAKLVRVIQGAVWDVAVDIRDKSPTFGKSMAVLLSGKNKKQMFIPRGFAHGFLTLEDNTIFSYKCDAYYNPMADAGIRFNDPQIGIEWPTVEGGYFLSEKDMKQPFLSRITTFKQV